MILLYLLRIVKPEVARDEDIFFATIGLLYSCILIIHGWLNIENLRMAGEKEQESLDKMNKEMI